MKVRFVNGDCLEVMRKIPDNVIVCSEEKHGPKSSRVLVPEFKNHHPTVKPLALMRYLCRLTRPPKGGIVLDPFAGSGTTGVACVYEDRTCLLIEKEKDFFQIMKARVRHAIEKRKQTR